MMSLLRLLVAKSDVIKTLIKRGEERNDDESLKNNRPSVSKDVIIYLGDIQGSKKKNKVAARINADNFCMNRSYRCHVTVFESLRKNLITIPLELSGTNFN